MASDGPFCTGAAGRANAVATALLPPADGATDFRSFCLVPVHEDDPIRRLRLQDGVKGVGRVGSVGESAIVLLVLDRRTGAIVLIGADKFEERIQALLPEIGLGSARRFGDGDGVSFPFLGRAGFGGVVTVDFDRTTGGLSRLRAAAYPTKRSVRR